MMSTELLCVFERRQCLFTVAEEREMSTVPRNFKLLDELEEAEKSAKGGADISLGASAPIGLYLSLRWQLTASHTIATARDQVFRARMTLL